MALHRFTTTLSDVQAAAAVADSTEILYSEYTSGMLFLANGNTITELTWYSAPEAGGEYEPAYDYDGVAIVQAAISDDEAHPIPLALIGCVAIKAVTTAGTADGIDGISLKS